MRTSKRLAIDEVIVVGSVNGNALSGPAIVKSSITPHPNISDSSVSLPSNEVPTFDSHSEAVQSRQSAFPGGSNPTPISFVQMMPTGLSNGLAPDVARRGGRRSRGIRHRGGAMVGGSMSVFSIKSDEPKTPTQRVRGSIRGKLSRTSSGSSKRKRSNENRDSDSESSENYTPLSQSRSGRKIIQATPVIKIEEQPKVSPKSSDKINSATKSTIKTPEKKRLSSKRTPGGASAVCKNCGRLHSPEFNAMVFCDGCNTGWHQHCHDPPIPPDIVMIESKEWFCTDCIVLKEEKSRLQGKVSGQNMSLLEKRKHLQTLSSKELVSLLLHACSVHPDLSIFNPPEGDTTMVDINDDEDMLPYPKPGNGLLLPPEKDNLHFLLDDDTDVYSHCTAGIAQLVAAARANMMRNNSITLIA